MTIPSSHAFLRKLESLLKIFSNVTREHAPDTGKKMGCKSIRVLRREIAREFDKTISSRVPGHETIRPLTSIGNEAEKLFPAQMTSGERVNGWLGTDPVSQRGSLPGHDMPICGPRNSHDHDHIDSEVTSLPEVSMDTVSTSNGSETAHLEFSELYPGFISKGDVLAYLTSHSAFETLINDIQLLIERFRCNKMDLIRDCVSLSLRRHGNSVNVEEQCRAAFHVDWDIPEFLESQYADGLEQDLSLSLCFVGQLVNAQLTTIGDYFQRVWPSCPSTLLNAIRRTIQRVGGKYCNTAPSPPSPP